MNILTLSRLLTTSLLATTSITLLTTTAILLSWESSQESNFEPIIKTQKSSYATLPLRLQEGSSWMIIAAGCGGVLDCLLSTFGIVRRGPVGKLNWYAPQWDLFTAALSGLRVIIGGAAIIFSFEQFYNSSSFVDGAVSDGHGVYSEGHFTVEAWNCQVRSFESGVDFGRFCRIGAASRWLLVPYVGLALVLLVLSMVSWNMNRRCLKIGGEPTMSEAKV